MAIRRKFPRAPLHVPAVLIAEGDDVERVGQARDISVGGMFVETSEPLAFGTRLVARVVMPDTKAALELPSKVRWVSPDGVGLQFGLLGARETHAITKVLAEASPLTPRRAATRRRVLIVDDSTDSAETVKTILDALGHETRVARDGPGALATCDAFTPDLVFLDIGLPGMNGYDVVARMRQLPACAKIPIIALSGYARDAGSDTVLTVGFSDYLTKPIEPTLFGEIVEACGRGS